MKKQYFKKTVLVFLLVTILLSASFTAVGVSYEKTTGTPKTTKGFLTKSRKVGDLKLINLKSNIESATGSEDIYQISDDSGDEYNIEMVSYQDKKLLSYEHIEDEKTDIRYRYSSNYEHVWSESNIVSFENNLFSPCLTLASDGNHAFGAFLSDANESTLIYEIEFTTLGSPGDTITSDTPWSENDFYDFKSADIIRYDDVTYENENMLNVPYIVSIIGSTYFDGADCENSPMFFFRSPEDPDSFTLAWDPNINDCSNLQIDRSDLNNLTYGVCEIENGTNTDLLFFDDNPIISGGAWEKEGSTLSSQIITSDGNLLNPKISVEENNVFIIAETDVNGKDELVLFNSFDLGENWEDPVYIDSNIKPNSDFSYSKENLQVDFFDNSFDIDGSIQAWSWDFGDGNESYIKNPSYTYESPGTYSVELTVIDNDNEIDIFTKEIMLTETKPLPDFSVDPNNPDRDENVTFNSTVDTFENREIVNYTWVLGEDIGPFYSQNITYNFQENGTYLVNLTVEDNESEIGYVEKDITIGLAADFSFTDKIFEPGETVDFVDLSNVPNGQTIVNSTWNFGDGETSDKVDPSHIYLESGFYTVEFTIENNVGLTSTVSKMLKVRTDDYGPNYPDLIIENDEIFVTYMSGNNLFLIGSEDTGETWSHPEMINDIMFSVSEGYKNTGIIGEEKIVFSDFREEKTNIYFYDTYELTFDLNILNVNLTSTRKYVKTNNYLTISVRNDGDVPTYENIEFEVSYKSEDENRTVFDYPYVIVAQINPGETYNLTRPLFKFAWPEYFNSMIDLVDIENIKVEAKIGGDIEDSDPSNNVFIYEKEDLYQEIFPILGKRTMLVGMLRFIGKLRDFGN